MEVFVSGRWTIRCGWRDFRARRPFVSEGSLPHNSAGWQDVCVCVCVPLGAFGWCGLELAWCLQGTRWPDASVHIWPHTRRRTDVGTELSCSRLLCEACCATVAIAVQACAPARATVRTDPGCSSDWRLALAEKEIRAIAYRVA